MGEAAINRLWDAILLTARTDGDDPEAAWDAHRANFDKALAFLNGHRFASPHYASAQSGTDFMVGTDATWRQPASKSTRPACRCSATERGPGKDRRPRAA